LCSLAICPVRSRDGAIALYINDFDDSSWKEEEEEEKIPNTTCHSHWNLKVIEKVTPNTPS
jgi:hypothetical protein